MFINGQSKKNMQSDERKLMTSYAKRILLVVCFSGSLFGALGCEQEGPAEKAGESVDESTEKAGEQLEQAGENIQDSAN